MNDTNVPPGPRRVVLDLHQPRIDHVPGSKKRRRKRKNKSGNHQVNYQQAGVVQLERDDVQLIPLELGSLIQEALAYGRKTHALGMLSAARTLSGIAERLKRTVGSEQNITIRSVIAEAEEESKKIMIEFDLAYNQEQDAEA